MRVIYVTFAMMLMFSLAVSAAEPPRYNIKVTVISEGAENSARGAGECLVNEGSYARINIALMNKGSGFRIIAVDPSRSPVMLLSEKSGTVFSDEYMAILDLYLRPSATPEKNISLSGVIGKLFNVGGDTELFKYSEEMVDFVISNGGEHTIKIETPFRGRDITLEISAYTKGEITYRQEHDRELKLKADYQLFNHDTKSIELKSDDCTMIHKDGELSEDSRCTFKMIFDLADGDILLYAATCEINNSDWNDDGTVSFDFLVSHIYAVNPEDTGMVSPELKAEKVSMTMFSKRLTVQTGERTEIEIPADTDSPLPFRSGELIALTNPDEYIPLDVEPQLVDGAPPVYPQKAKKDGVNGNVMVRAYIDKQGVVKRAMVVECNRPGYGFEEAALEAAYKSKYTPGMEGDRPVAVWVSYMVKFKLD